MNKEKIDKTLGFLENCNTTDEELVCYVIKLLKEEYLNAVADYEQEKAKNSRAIEYNEHLIRDAKYKLNLGHLKKMRKILKGESNEV